MNKNILLTLFAGFLLLSVFLSTEVRRAKRDMASCNKEKELFLKKDFCYSCIVDILPELLDKLGQHRSYLIVSHPENACLLKSFLPKEKIKELVVWHDDYLYGRFNNEYDAELIFLDNQNRVTAIIPLVYFFIEGLFDGLLARVMAD